MNMNTCIAHQVWEQRLLLRPLCFERRCVAHRRSSLKHNLQEEKARMMMAHTHIQMRRGVLRLTRCAGGLDCLLHSTSSFGPLHEARVGMTPHCWFAKQTFTARKDTSPHPHTQTLTHTTPCLSAVCCQWPAPETLQPLVYKSGWLHPAAGRRLW